jgi:hypothetical protein
MANITYSDRRRRKEETHYMSKYMNINDFFRDPHSRAANPAAQRGQRAAPGVRA